MNDLNKIVAARNAKLAAANKPSTKRGKKNTPAVTNTSMSLDICKRIPLSAVRTGSFG